METKYLIWTFGTYFAWWAINLILERAIGMQPMIFHRDTLLQADSQMQQQLGARHFHNLFMRGTKSIDRSGTYRMQIRPALIYTKCIALLAMTAVAFWQLFKAGGLNEYINLFYHMEPGSIYLESCQIAASMVVSWYMFEIGMLFQYYKLDISAMLHHWLTFMAGGMVLAGVELPYAIWYGITLLAFTFPVSFIKAFSLHLGHKYPKMARKGNLATYYFHLGLIFFGAVGSLLIWAQGIRTGTASTFTIVLIPISVVAWVYDDLRLAFSLKRASRNQFELVDYRKLPSALPPVGSSWTPAAIMQESPAPSPGQPENTPEPVLHTLPV